ncbi:helix-turn-helix domain-containing protein [Larkinella sp. GY13]|uniref:helix-turn-helix domain-containing protein n=1 Tax=Larkinella sp. GY13 TaxID=3453720 RepID=UPI003EEFB0D0
MQQDIDIARILRKLRDLYGYTLEGVADGLGKSTEGYRKYEAGQTDPTFKTLQQLACFYRITVVQLIAFDEESMIQIMVKNRTQQKKK